MTIHLTLVGDVPSLKNSRVFLRKGTRPCFAPSDAYIAWHTEQALAVRVQTQELQAFARFPYEKCAIQMKFWSSTMRRADLDNKAQSVADLLTDCGVISDDSWHVVPDLHLLYMGKDKENARVELTIKQL